MWNKNRPIQSFVVKNNFQKVFLTEIVKEVQKVFSNFDSMDAD
jgi:hypothetical protein